MRVYKEHNFGGSQHRNIYKHPVEAGLENGLDCCKNGLETPDKEIKRKRWSGTEQESGIVGNFY